MLKSAKSSLWRPESSQTSKTVKTSGPPTTHLAEMPQVLEPVKFEKAQNPRGRPCLPLVARGW
eukprot:6943857-Prymnesium_polylepis.1